MAHISDENYDIIEEDIHYNYLEILQVSLKGKIDQGKDLFSFYLPFLSSLLLV